MMQDTFWTGSHANPFESISGINASDMRMWHDLLLKGDDDGLETPLSQLELGDTSELCLCGGHLQKQASHDNSICESCGRISTVHTGVEMPSRSVMLPLVLVGTDRQKFQPNMYRSGSGPSDEHKRKSIATTFNELFDRFVEGQGLVKRDLPRDAIPLAADIYGVIQGFYVKRSVSRKRIMAACLQIAFYKIGYSSSSKELASVMQLSDKGRLASGNNFISNMAACGKLPMAVIEVTPEEKLVCVINTLFARIGYGDEAYEDLRKAVNEIYQVAIEKEIGVASMMNSKVNGATFAVLHRSPLIADPPPIDKFCLESEAKSRIRNKTVTNFLDEMKRYHTHFEPLYQKYQLRDGKDLPAVVQTGRKKKNQSSSM